VLKISYTLAGGPRLQPIEPIDKSGTVRDSKENLPEMMGTLLICISKMSLPSHTDGKDNYTFNHLYLSSGIILNTVKSVTFNLVHFIDF
jgi:hypothetical protein